MELVAAACNSSEEALQQDESGISWSITSYFTLHMGATKRKVADGALMWPVDDDIQ